ncbi:MAG TPA: bifunctional acetate--CoA ligase family protein/GNAT family N-acetyltransferase [Geminicoccaceae bacterium]|nr:bifunctional acetate--CoA ligase family protein/GNAT family N-acetyltransferase [Geminicoccaceae bacterium]
MSVRNLELLFRPASIALIGASKTPRSIGAVLAHNLFNAGFDGPIMPVNPHHQAIEGVLTYPSIEALPLTPDLAVLATPPATILQTVGQLGARGTRAVVVISAGFAELGEQGAALQQAMLAAARPGVLRIVGPNCLGVMVPGHGLNASFAQGQALEGDLAFVSQSGAVLAAVLDWASARGVGFSHMVSLGGMADVDFGDLLDYLATDRHTRAILLYVEAITHARKFMSAARAAARSKPVVVVKAGRSTEVAKAVQSHTGALAGSDRVYDAAFGRAGMLRVETLDELFAAVETLASGVRLTGDRLAIVSNGGGIGVLATDALIQAGGRLAELAPATLERLDAVLPPTWSRGNPVDIIGDAPGERYGAALEAVLADRSNDAVLVLNCPTAVADSADAARATVAAAKKVKRAVLTSWLGESAALEARGLFAREHMPTYETPTAAVQAFMHLVRYRRNQELLQQVPPSIPDDFEPHPEQAQAIMARALDQGRTWLTEVEAKNVLAAYAIPVVPTTVVTSPDEAAETAARIGRPVALKILSADITHKSDVGGVMLGLADPWNVHEAARTMLENLRARRPNARVEGLNVQPMVDTRGGQELIIGMIDDALFGPVILFGQGGTAVEVVRDQALALPPLNLHLAHELMRATRVFRLLQGFRDRPAADLDAIALTLVKVAQMVADLDQIAELDINPLLASAEGVVALDARIRIAEPRRRGTDRLAIRPYPKELEQTIALPKGRTFLLRPIRPEDAPAFRRLVEEGTEPEDRRLRFFTVFRTLAPDLCARLTQIDYEREMALVALEPDARAEDPLCGVVRLAADPDRERAEYAILVRSDLKGQGLGTVLMQTLIAYARAQGIGELFGTVLQENRAMLEVVERLGFKSSRQVDDATMVEVRLRLREEAA